MLVNRGTWRFLRLLCFRFPCTSEVGDGVLGATSCFLLIYIVYIEPMIEVAVR